MPIAAILELVFALEPKIPGLIADFKAIIGRHPALADPAAQAAFITALGQAAISVDDATIAKWAADQAPK
jgi:hypothetical protein